MPKPTEHTLPQQAIDHMSPQAKEALSHTPAPVDPSPANIIRDDPSSQSETLFGTSGPDIFVFDVNARTEPGIDGVELAFISGFEPGVDKIAFVNVPENYALNEGHFLDSSWGGPAEESQFSVSNPNTNLAYAVANIVDATVPLGDVSVHLNDPFLIT